MNIFKLLGLYLLLSALPAFTPVASAEAARRGDQQGAGQEKVQQRPQPRRVEKLIASQQGEAIALRWPAVKGNCDGYRIYHEAGDKLLPDSLWFDVDTTRTEYLFTDVAAGGEFTFRVSALYGRDEGLPSAPVTVRLEVVKKSSGLSDIAR